MKPRFNVLTIGVSDLERSLKFYRDGMRLKTQGVIGAEFEHGAVVFFDFQHGMKFALYERNNLAWDSGLEVQQTSGTEFSIGHLVSSREEVNAVMEQASKAGAKTVKPAQETFWGGYTGYFQEPDGHLWEIAWNPQWKIED